MAKVTQQQIHTLVSLYLSEYKKKYQTAPLNFNRNREKWGFQSMIEDLGIDRAKEVITFYFSTGKRGHPVSYLLNQYDAINIRMIEVDQDIENRRRLLEETRARVEQWRETVGQ